MVWLRFASRQTFWRDYFSILRVGLSFGVALGFGAFLYGALRERLREAENKLHEKEVAEERSRNSKPKRGSDGWSPAFILISSSTP